MRRSHSHKPGLAGRRLRNMSLRAIGEEPVPGLYAGVKRWARYIKRALRSPQVIRPERAALFMHSYRRRLEAFYG